MRIRLPIGRSLLFVAAFAVALLATLPMRLGIDWLGIGHRGVAAREVSGSIWGGALKEAQFGSVGLGDLHAGLRGLPLVAGRARIAMEQAGPAGSQRLDGALTVTRNSFGVSDVDGPVPLAGALGRLPLAQVDLSAVNVRFEGGQCAEASGQVRAAVAGDMGGLALPGGLSGTARCDAGALLLPMVSQSNMEALDLRLFGDGRYQGMVTIRSADPSLGARMAAAGFSPTAVGYGLTIDGRF